MFNAMKKIFSFAIVVAAAAMISCGGNANNQAAADAEATVECKECEKADSCCCCEKADSTAAEATEAPAEATK